MQGDDTRSTPDLTLELRSRTTNYPERPARAAADVLFSESSTCGGRGFAYVHALTGRLSKRALWSLGSYARLVVALCTAPACGSQHTRTAYTTPAAHVAPVSRPLRLLPPL